jgi:hypothetical protein
MRRFSAILFLLLILLSMGGRSLLFSIQLAEVRTAMRAALVKGDHPYGVETLCFSRAAFGRLTWLDGGREFEWQGRRYDLLSTKYGDGVVQVDAIADHNETALVAAYQKQHHERTPSKLLQKLLVVPYVLTPTLAVPFPKYQMRVPYARYHDVPVQRGIPVPTPPPLVVAFISC